METIKLSNVKNIRDISYANIKEKRLIRSSSLDKINDEDTNILLYKYNVKTIIDLRTHEEIKRRPDKLVPEMKYINIPLLKSSELGITHENGINRIPNKIPDFIHVYPKMLTIDKQKSWSKIFDVFSNENNGTILWHCTVGKDRCGLVSVFLEYILGLNEELIIYDYLYSNNFIDLPLKYKLASNILKKESKEKFKNMFIAKKEYLMSAINYINETYGSIDDFLKIVCGVNEEKKNRIRSLYLK